MTPFVRAAEIWKPDAQGYLLEFGGGLYGQAPEFGAISRAMCFGRGEGLPGRVWDEGRPVVLRDLQDGYFQRAAAAKAAGLTCAVAFPVFFAAQLKAVVVLFCGDVAGQSGAIEVWLNDPRASTDLALLDGVYGGAEAAFEQASRATTMARGVGLPGLAWQRRGAVLMDGLGDSTTFVRSEAASATGLRSGFALPCPAPGDANVVLAFLSAPSTPIAKRIECWTAAADGQSLTMIQSAFGTGTGDAGVQAPDAAILAAFATGVPGVQGAGALQPPGEGSSRAPEAPGEPVVVLPITIAGVVTETVALYL